MTNLQVEKEIRKATKGVDEFKVTINLWHADDEVYNMLEIEDGAGNTVEHGVYLKSTIDCMEDNQGNIKVLKKEQQKLYKHLTTYFDVNIEESYL